MVDVVVAEHPVVDVVVAEHPVVGVVVAEHPVVGVVVDDVVGAFAEQPCATEAVVVVAIGVAVAVELDDICATAPTTPKTEKATAATTRTAAIFLTAIFLVAVPSFFLGGATTRTTGKSFISAPLSFLGRF